MVVGEEACCLLCLETFPVYASTCFRADHSTGLSLDKLFTQALDAPMMDADKPLDRLVTLPLQALKTEAEQGDCGNTIMGNVSKCYTKAKSRSNASTATTESPTRMCSSGNASVAESTSMDEESDGGKEQEATTMMICGLPCRLMRDDIVSAIHDVGFGDKYEFVYLVDGLADRKRRSKGARSSGNLGYAFVDFKNAQHAEDFVLAFDNYHFSGTGSTKRCSVKYAHCQGFNANHSILESRHGRGSMPAMLLQ